MRRKTKQKFESLQKALKTPPTKTWQTYDCTLVTPMYGGGVEAGKVDTAMPIRASAIRGQLRFWWRIACGPFNSPKEMFDRETEIWGGIGDEGAKASQVEIRVKPFEEKNVFRVQSVAEFKRRKPEGIKYVLGTIIKDAAKRPSILSTDIPFKLSICCNANVKAEVTAALEWWATFGGIGAKTRRGLGAVKFESDKGVQRISLDKFDNQAKTYKGCTLALAQKSYDRAQDAWYSAAEFLYEFRQKPDIGRKAKDNGDPGRSFWPEADQLRHITKSYPNKHKPDFSESLIFPRAAFGMPIQFQFKTIEEDGGITDLSKIKQDPPKVNLQPKGVERLASPIVLNVVQCGNKWKAVALRLPSWELALRVDLELKWHDKKQFKKEWLRKYPKSWDSASDKISLANTIEPMESLQNKHDPLSAFLEYFAK